MAVKIDHLAMAKEDLAIAESTDAKREAYIRAADHIAAHKVATKATNKDIAMSLNCHENVVDRLLGWRKRGYNTDSPYDEGPQKQQQVRARISHTRRVLREDPVEVAEEIAEALTDPNVVEAVQAKIADSPRRLMAHMDAQSEVAKRKGVIPRRPPPPSRDQIDAERPDMPAPPPPDPWKPFWQAIALLHEVYQRVHPGMWDLPDEMLAAIARDAGEQAEMLGGLAETARQKVAEQRV